MSSICLSNNLPLKLATDLITFSGNYNTKLNKKLQFPILSKIIQMTHLINGVSDLEIEEKLCIALNRILISPLSDDSNKKKDFGYNR